MKQQSFAAQGVFEKRREQFLDEDGGGGSMVCDGVSPFFRCEAPQCRPSGALRKSWKSRSLLKT
jgi:hypothetical protein